MRIAESVTFAGAGIDRAAWLRGDKAALALRLAAPETRVLPVWRGKPLVGPEGAGFLPAAHPLFAEAAGDPVFLGLTGGAARFARDLSDWEPPEDMPKPERGFFDPTEQHHPDLPPDWRFAELRGVMAHLPRADAEFVAAAKAILGWQRSHRFCSTCGQESEMVLAGWQRRCPACGAMHFPRTDPVVIMLVTHGNRTLLGRSPGWPDGMYSCLAGFMEPGETIEDAVRRETHEETSVRVGRVAYLGCQPWPFPSNLMLGCIGEAETTGIAIDPAELEDAQWVSRAEMQAILNGGHARIAAPRRDAIARAIQTDWVKGDVPQL